MPTLNSTDAAKRLRLEVGSLNFRVWYRTRYLSSGHWLNLRAVKLAAASVCEVCRTRRAVQVHHVFYRSIYDVTPADLQSVCRSCHRAEHGITKPDRQQKRGRSMRGKLRSSTNWKPKPKKWRAGPQTFAQRRAWEQIKRRGRL